MCSMCCLCCFHPDPATRPPGPASRIRGRDDLDDLGMTGVPERVNSPVLMLLKVDELPQTRPGVVMPEGVN